MRNLASFSTSLDFEPPAFENATRYRNSETNFLCSHDRQLNRLLYVLRAAARLVYGVRKFDHMTPLLRELHWLSVPERITFRLATLMFHCLHGTAPAYLAESYNRAADDESRRRLGSGETCSRSRSNIEVAITPPLVARFYSDLVQSFIRSQAMHYKCSRSKLKGQEIKGPGHNV